MLNLAVALEDSAARYPNREAVVSGPVRLTYREVDEQANRIAHLLADLGIGRGHRVALTCPNVPEFITAYYGILKSGATVVPLNILLKAREVAYHLRDAQASAYLCFVGTPDVPMGVEGRAGFDQVPDCEHFLLIGQPPSGSAALERSPLLSELVADRPTTFSSAATEATDTAVILYTSGTTGQPKGAELTHANMTLNALTAHRAVGREGVDTHLVALPLFHSFGQTLQMNGALAGGNRLVLMPRFDPGQAVGLILAEDVTHVAGVPTMFHALLSALTDADYARAVSARLEVVLSGGAAMPVELLRQVETRLGVRVYEGYGLSETSPGVCLTPPSEPARPGSIGREMWGVQLRLIDDQWNEIDGGPDALGEIAIKGHPVMKGYFNRPEATAEVLRDGWFRTGDLARRDEDGFYFIVDRAKDLVIRGGYNVYPRELEELLITHPEVSLAAVVGVPHESHGEEVKAFVLPVEGSSITADEIVDWCRETMAAYKRPRIVELVESFPMTATGKILKRELSAR